MTDDSEPKSPPSLKSASSSVKAKGWQLPTPEQLQIMLPQYAITTLLGRGGMGAVYRGTQKNLDRPVAIKILPPGIDEEDDGSNFSERFKNEARAMAKLSHPGIVAVYDSGETADGLLYIVMEFIEGTDVQKMVSEQKRLHSEHAMAITAHVCDALKYAHERGIIHRDIKPANIMVGYDGVVKVADFGLAKMSKAGESGLTRSGMAMGTLHYMAPEALMLGSSVDHRSDIYAVGVMLYFMLTGRLPQGMFELPSMQVSGLDPRYDGIIAKALRDDRDIRYQSTAELRRDLDGILTQPVVKVSAGDQQAAAALPTAARPQAPAGNQGYYRPPVAQADIRVEKRGSPLLWAAIVVMSGLALWLWLNKPPGSEPSQTVAGTTKDEPSVIITAPGDWKPLLKDKPEVIKRLKITDATTPGWKLMQRGFAPVLDAKNVALRMKARGHSLRLVARWSETADNGAYGHTLRIGPDTDGKTRMFGGWIETLVTTSDGIVEPQKYKSSGPPAFFETPEGQEYEIELRSFESRLEVLVDGKVMQDVRNISLPGNVVALHPFREVEFKDLEWRELPPDTAAIAQTQALRTSPPPPAISIPSSQLAPGVWHDLFEKKLISTAGLVREPANGGSNMAGYRATSTVTASSTVVFKDCVVRARFGSGTWTSVPQIVIRRKSPGSSQYISALFFDYNVLLRNHRPNGYGVFAKAKSESSFAREKAFELQLLAVGDRYVISKDGKALVEGKTTGYDTGCVGFNLDKGTAILSFEVMPLDGLSEKERDAALVAVKSSATPPPPVPASTQAMKLVVDADFQQKQAAFPDSQTSNLHTRWENQSYRMTAKSSALWWAGPAALRALKLDDFVCEAEFRVPREAAGKWGIGLVHPKMPWIGASTDAAGKAEIYRYDDAHLLRATTTAASAAGGDWNKLRMEVTGEQMRLFINDRHVADASTAGLQKPHSLTLFLSTPEPSFEVWLRRIKVWQPETVAAATIAPVMPAVMPPPAAAPPDPLKLSLVHRFDFNDGLTPGSGKGAKVEDGELLVDGDYKHLGAVEDRPLLTCTEFQDEQFTIVLKLRHDRLEDALLVGGVTRWLAVKTLPGGSLELSMANGRHQVGVYNANVPMKKPFVLAVSGNLKSGPIQIHVDGRPIKSVPVPARLDNASAGDKYLTFVNLSTTDTLKGAVDEVQVYKRILSDNEIASLMTPAKPPVPTASVAAGALPSWTDRNGRRITAQFVRVDDTTLTLRMNGKEVPVPLGSLSEESRLLAATFTPAAKPQTLATSLNNSLGMKFVPVPGTRVLFCTHETRHRDFAAYANEAKSITGIWKNQSYSGIEITARKDEHPVTQVTPKQAVQFCAWLSQKEGKKYRLPTKEEWSLAANAGGKAEFPWGDAWPPPQGVGNFSDESYHKLRPTDPYLSGYDDGFPTTAPVMSFKPNGFGIYDLGGNVWEMTHAGDPAAAAFSDFPPMVDRGASFLHDAEKSLRSAKESSSVSSTSAPDRGFRIVMETTP